MKLVVFVGACLMLSGCTTLQGDDYGVFDPYEGVNRKSYALTDTVDRAVLEPVARGYDEVTPNWLQLGILNVFRNLRTIGSSVNGFLQAKPETGMTDFFRVVVNSTVGVGGFFDVASHMGLDYGDEDLGQTLAVWGVKKSRYVFVPFLGPSTVRDFPSMVIRGYLPRFILGSNYHWSFTVVDVVSNRADLLSASEVRDVSAMDPYAFTRDAYIQRRKFQIYDGAPPLEDLFDEFEEFEEDYDEDDEYEATDEGDTEP